MTTPEIYRLETPSVSLDEILRYMGAKQAAEPVRTLAKEALEEIRNAAECRACLTRLPLSVAGAEIVAGSLTLHSADLAKNLNGCTAGFCICRYHWACLQIAKLPKHPFSLLQKRSRSTRRRPP